MGPFSISSASIGADIRAKILLLRCRNDLFSRTLHELFDFAKSGLEFHESEAREIEFTS
jgi:hypothetical protein